MTYTDYMNWAKEYRDQVEVLERKLEKRKGKQHFKTPDDRRVFESTTRILYEMRLDCIKTAAVLEKKAFSIREDEQYAEDSIA